VQLFDVKENEVGRAYGMHEQERKVYKVSVGKPEGKRPLGRPRHRWMRSEGILGVVGRVDSVGSR
jgi:hypothetical protein